VIFVSVTRLRVRSFLYLPQFLWHAARSMRQTEHSPGFLDGQVQREARNTFWTVTLWNDPEAMNAFRLSGAHRAVMPKLLDWCDEASVAHGAQETAQLPEWAEAHRRIVAEGRPSKVNHPSSDHSANRIPSPQPSRIRREMKPVRS
jgi:heme-degrading monooxygenase HmoA